MALTIENGVTLFLWAATIGVALIIAFKAPPLFVLYKAYADSEAKESARQQATLLQMRQDTCAPNQLSGKDLRRLRRKLSEVYHPATWCVCERLIHKDLLSEDDLDAIISAISTDEATSLPFWRRFRWAAKDILSKFWFSKAVKNGGEPQAIDAEAPSPAVAIKIAKPVTRVLDQVLPTVRRSQTNSAKAN